MIHFRVILDQTNPTLIHFGYKMLHLGYEMNHFDPEMNQTRYEMDQTRYKMKWEKSITSRFRRIKMPLCTYSTILLRQLPRWMLLPSHP